jgi:hypothetical protein
MGAFALHAPTQERQGPPQARGLQVHKRYVAGKPVPRWTVDAPHRNSGGETVAWKGTGQIDQSAL